MLALIFSPSVNQFDRHMPRWLAIMIVYAGVLVLFGVLIAYAAPLIAEQGDQVIDMIPQSNKCS